MLATTLMLVASPRTFPTLSGREVFGIAELPLEFGAMLPWSSSHVAVAV